MAGFLDNLPDLGLPDPPLQRRRPAPEVDVVTWTRPLCPKCKSANCPVVDSHNIPVRWHECQNPQCPGRSDGKPYRFKSIETNYRSEVE